MHDRKTLLSGKVLSNREVLEGHFLMSVRLPRNFGEPLPGQFVMVRVKGEGRLLGRPFSICGFQKRRNSAVIEILYRVVGGGTLALSQHRGGCDLEILGPLGRSFEMPRQIGNVVLVAGGMGIAPLRFLLAFLHDGFSLCPPGIRLYVGAKTAGDLIGLEGLERTCREILVCTDDCSRGYAGPVTAPLESDLKSFAPEDTILYACGPVAMIRRIAQMLKDHPVPCQVSMEERMACGVGACLGCAVAVDGWNGKRQYVRVCKDGPVFDIRDIRWDEGSGRG